MRMEEENLNMNILQRQNSTDRFCGGCTLYSVGMYNPLRLFQGFGNGPVERR
jgi:hypothetical protein